MIAFSNQSLIVLALGCLVLNWYAFRVDAAAAGHGRQQKIKLAAIWVTIIVCMTLAIRFLRP